MACVLILLSLVSVRASFLEYYTKACIHYGEGDTPLYGLYRYVRPKGYGFSAVLNRVSILADFGHFCHK